MTEPYPLIVVLGPTASGKSALAITLARTLHGEVLACDSTQVYRYFDIGTGKVLTASQQGIPHHLIDLLEPDEVFTAGDYQRRARAVLTEVHARGRLPIVTAGTGLYLRALLEGLSPLPPRAPVLRARLHACAAERGVEYLHRMLARIDPNSASEIGLRDTPKLVRALELCFQTRRSRRELFAQGRARLEDYAVNKIGLLPPRVQLYARIEERVEAMLRAGWLEETRQLVARFRRLTTARPFQFLGYRQLCAQLAGELTLKEAIKQIKHETRQYAKRQITWFRKEPAVSWFAGFGDDRETQAAIIAYLRNQRPTLPGSPAEPDKNPPL
mgnify:CR=1 FL=1